MRIKNSAKNIKYNLVFFIINSFLAFFSKKVFLTTLGYEITGLNSLFQNLVGFLNIAELGITNAVTYSLYKPLREQNYKKINSILLAYKYLYEIVALIIFIGTIILSFFLNKVVNGVTININTIRFYFVFFAITPVISYLISYLQVVVIADQKSYIVSKVIGITKIVKTSIQILLLIYNKSYLLWLVLELVFNVVAFLYLNRQIKRQYIWINIDRKYGFKELFKKEKQIIINTKDMFFHKIGGFVLNQTDNIVISTFTNIKNVTIYSNYIMIVMLIKSLYSQVIGGISASIGNLVSEENNERSYNLWVELYYITTLSSVVVCYFLYTIINRFITLWVGNEYLFNTQIVFYIIINLFFALWRQSVDCFKEAYGIFWDRLAPVVEATLNLILSILLAKKIGVMGVVIGTNISNFMIIGIWRPYILFREGFRKNVLDFYVISVKLLFMSIVSMLVSGELYKYLYLSRYLTWYSFILESFIKFFITVISTILICSISNIFRKILKKYFKLIISM